MQGPMGPVTQSSLVRGAQASYHVTRMAEVIIGIRMGHGITGMSMTTLTSTTWAQAWACWLCHSEGQGSGYFPLL